MAPMVTWLMSALWLGERAFTPSRHAGMVLGLAGLTVMFATAVDIDARAAIEILNLEF